LLLSEQETPPQGVAWAHEIKFDGYCTQARLADGKVTIDTRRGNDWTCQCQLTAHAVTKLPAKRAVIDGEAVVPSEAAGNGHELVIAKWGLIPFWSSRSRLPSRRTRRSTHATIGSRRRRPNSFKKR
jgi:ATP-dependent DNA ligase